VDLDVLADYILELLRPGQEAAPAVIRKLCEKELSEFVKEGNLPHVCCVGRLRLSDTR
jgi:hypothetical protein